MVVKFRLWLKLCSRKESFFSMKTNPAGSVVRSGRNKMLTGGGKSGTFHIFMNEKQGFSVLLSFMMMAEACSRIVLPVSGGTV
ncbi:MAG TPA: hypothetical protein DEB17_05400 [Chlorobaculum sp.]|uniref:Uncharacterized protein n=2 Tax=Chlorobaculum tepidum TaxID=1097 RepID=Q8KAR5_CHLTE|nr:hypothetical protein CT2090 [Chlorobaculum tepidum TLS]HBU23421.1 hypothetical protein [Chlorobaculum sp.]